MPGECANHYTTGCATAQDVGWRGLTFTLSPFLPPVPRHLGLTHAWSCLGLTEAKLLVFHSQDVRFYTGSQRFGRRKRSAFLHPPHSRSTIVSNTPCLPILEETHDSPVGEETSTTWSKGQNRSAMVWNPGMMTQGLSGSKTTPPAT